VVGAAVVTALPIVAGKQLHSGGSYGREIVAGGKERNNCNIVILDDPVAALALENLIEILRFRTNKTIGIYSFS
jgi:hypothetical protein